jgi:excisionase family DNA binding protein
MNMKLLFAEQVAEILGVRIDRVYELARRNEIPVVRLGRQVRFDEEELHVWIKKGGTIQPPEVDEGRGNTRAA